MQEIGLLLPLDLCFLFKNDEKEIYKSFNPYWTEYGKLYNDNIIDEKTYKDNKFKIF